MAAQDAPGAVFLGGTSAGTRDEDGSSRGSEFLGPGEPVLGGWLSDRFGVEDRDGSLVPADADT